MFKFLLIAILFISVRANSQTVTLEDLINESLLNNYSIKNRKSERKKLPIKMLTSVMQGCCRVLILHVVYRIQ